MADIDAKSSDLTISFFKSGIGSVLKGHLLRVPLNQREYSWREKHIVDLFGDLSFAQARGDYFLGTIVTIPLAGREGTLEVIDGQQRLATTAILLAAIRDRFALMGSAEQTMVDWLQSFLIDVDPAENAKVSRIRLNVADGAYFDQRVRNSDPKADAKTESNKRINRAAELAAEHVAAMLKTVDPKNHAATLRDFVKFIEHKAVVIRLEVSNYRSAYKMFETLNDRGLRTSQADLVKNHLFGEIKAADRLDEAQHKWSSMKAVLESITDDDEITIQFLHHLMISMRGHLRHDDVFDKVQAVTRGYWVSLPKPPPGPGRRVARRDPRSSSGGR